MTAYDALSDEAKAAVSNIGKLTEAEKAFAAFDVGAGTIYDSGSVALTDLRVGDILKGGVTLTGEDADKVGLQRLAIDGEKQDGQFIIAFEFMTPLLGEDATVTVNESAVFTPVADDGSEACVAVKGTKKVPVGFTLWLGLDADGAAYAECVESASGDAVAGEDAAAGKADIAAAEQWTLAVSGEAVDTLGWNGSKFSSGDNASAKVTYAKKTGLFSGSYKVATVAANGRTKKTTVKFCGVFINGVGYGTTTKGVVSAPVELLPSENK